MEASHTILKPTAVDLKAVTAWGLDSLNKAKLTFDTYVPLCVISAGGPKLTGRVARATAATLLTLLISLLVYEQLNYRAKKGNLPGPTWTIPVIGKFADSLYPTLEKVQEAVVLWRPHRVECLQHVSAAATPRSA